MGRDVTSIEVKRSTWKLLNRLKEPGDTFDDIIRGLVADGDAEGPVRGDDRQSTSPEFECPTCGEGYPTYEAVAQHIDAAGH